jgi:MFS family permease
MTTRTAQAAFVVLVCGTLLVFLSFGVRTTFGFFMAPVSSDLGWGREVLSFAAALQNLVWGISTPLFGFLSDRYGPAKVAAAGGALYTGGLLLMSQAAQPTDAVLGIGVMCGLAAAMTGFPIILSVIGRKFPPETRSFYLGVASAGGASGQLLFVPLGQQFIQANGWAVAFIYLALIVGLTIPLSAALAGGNARAADDHSTLSFKDAMREAFAHKGFRLLVCGYFVCGAQVMFITQHMPAYLSDLGHPPWVATVAITLIGAFNIVGSIIWGKLGGIYPKKYMLCLLYGLRSVTMLVFIMFPITPTSVIIFTSVMGLMWLGTVPLTSGIVAQVFGTRYMATLVGVTFISHQVGSFLGVWMGGISYDLYGTYEPVFWGAIIIGFAASLVHYPIDERPIQRLRSPAPQAAE